MTQNAPQTGDRATHDETPRIDTPAAAEALCAKLTLTIGELVSTLDRETGQLRKGRAPDMTALHARKSSLTATLTRQMAQFARDSQYIAMAAPERVEEIRVHQQAFQKSLLANEDALNAMKLVSESLLRTIAAKVGEAKGGPQVYGGDGEAGRTGSASAPAISLDRNL